MSNTTTEGQLAAATTLLNNLTALKTSLPTLPLEEQIERTSHLWEVANALTAVIDAVKESVREHAVAQMQGPGSLELPGVNYGTAKVTVPTDSLKMADVDVGHLKATLGSLFDTLFEEVTTVKVRKDYDKKVIKISDPNQRTAALNAVAHVPNTPRVAFARAIPKSKTAGIEGDHSLAEAIKTLFA